MQAVPQVHLVVEGVALALWVVPVVLVPQVLVVPAHRVISPLTLQAPHLLHQVPH
jgi:hypothetical protein